MLEKRDPLCGRIEPCCTREKSPAKDRRTHPDSHPLTCPAPARFDPTSQPAPPLASYRLFPPLYRSWSSVPLQPLPPCIPAGRTPPPYCIAADQAPPPSPLVSQLVEIEEQAIQRFLIEIDSGRLLSANQATAARSASAQLRLSAALYEQASGTISGYRRAAAAATTALEEDITAALEAAENGYAQALGKDGGGAVGRRTTEVCRPARAKHGAFAYLFPLPRV